MSNKLKKAAKLAGNYKYMLIVMRHAKTEPSNEHGDFERELLEKGQKQAKVVAKGLKQYHLVPDQIDCSNAVRARQTCHRMLKVFGDDPKVEYSKALYEDGMQSVFDALASCKEKRHTLMIIGHEPTVSMACQWLASKHSDAHMIDVLHLGLSTASVAIFGANEPFKKWGTHDADLLAVLSAKDFE